LCCDRRQELDRCPPIRLTIRLSVVLVNQGSAATTVLVVADAGKVAPVVGEVKIGGTTGRARAVPLQRGTVRAAAIGIVRVEPVASGGAMSGAAGALMTGVLTGDGMGGGRIGRVGRVGAMSEVAAAAGVRTDRAVVAGGMSGAMTAGRIARPRGGCRSMRMSPAQSSTARSGRS